MTGPSDLARAILADQGINATLRQVGGKLWQYRATKGSQGVAVDIEGEPDEAIIREAAQQIVEALN